MSVGRYHSLSKSPRDFASELRKALAEYLDRTESRSIKREIELKDRIVQLSFEAVRLLETSLSPTAQLVFWVEEYEAARKALLRIHQELRAHPTDSLVEAERKAMERFALATKALAHQVAAILTS